MNPHNVATLICCFAAFTLVGCSDATKSSTTQETTITTPGGTAKVTVEKKVKESGRNPPKVAP